MPDLVTPLLEKVKSLVHLFQLSVLEEFSIPSEVALNGGSSRHLGLVLFEPLLFQVDLDPPSLDPENRSYLKDALEETEVAITARLHNSPPLLDPGC